MYVRSSACPTACLLVPVLALIALGGGGGCASPPLATQAADLHPAGPPADVPAGSGGSLRVMTWNIHNGEGDAPGDDLHTAAAVIRTHRPDLVALQEVDRWTKRAGGDDQAERLGELTGMAHVYAPAGETDGGTNGPAVLSRWPIESHEVVDLPDGAVEPAVALLVRVTPPGAARPVTFVCCHFDFVPLVGGRAAQARRLMKRLKSEPGPVILAGDVNATPAEGEMALVLRHLNPVLKPDEQRFTFSAFGPRREIDYVFYRPAGVLAARGSRVVDGRRASDHGPVVAEFNYVLNRAGGNAPTIAPTRAVANDTRLECR